MSRSFVVAELTTSILLFVGGQADARLMPFGVLDDEQTSIVYVPDTGEVAVDAPASKKLTSININTADHIFGDTTCIPLVFDCGLDTGRYNLFKAPFGNTFGDFSFGNLAQPALGRSFVLNDLSAIGSLAGGGNLGEVDLVYMRELQPGDADRNFTFDQLDMVKIQQSAKYLTGLVATWGEGDWDGGPGGYPGAPPVGNGLFDQVDIVAALQAGVYLAGPYAAIGLGGVEGDGQTSLVYWKEIGRLRVDTPFDAEWINICSDGGKLAGEKCIDIFPDGSSRRIAAGNVLPAWLSEEDVAADLTVIGLLADGSDLGEVDLDYRPQGPILRAGDADQDLDFDGLDLVAVLIAAKYLTGQAATWGEGDWNGAPGGSPGNPPAGDGLFNQLDIIAFGGEYNTGPYAAIAPSGREGDVQTSMVYDANTGNLSIDPPAGKELTSLNVTSAGSLFTGSRPQALDGVFDNFATDNIFKATFGGSFGYLEFTEVLPAGLTEAAVAADISVVGSLAGGGGLGDVDLVYIPIPEPSAIVLLAMFLGSLASCRVVRSITAGSLVGVMYAHEHANGRRGEQRYKADCGYESTEIKRGR